MNSRGPAILLIILSGGYAIGFLFSVIIEAIVSDSLPNLHHTMRQGMILLFIFSIGILFTSVYMTYLFPEIRDTVHKTELKSNATPFEVLLYVSTDEEVSLLQSIKELSPRAYKFELARKTGLSRMKVHRILLRLAERGILHVEKEGRYSQVTLADWLMD